MPSWAAAGAAPAAAPSLPRSSTIHRRRKAGDADDADMEGGGGPCPVSITLELLESMADLTIVAAAQRIRVSTTSLKKACRKLGVDRWPYRGGRLLPNSAGHGPAPPRDFDEAYVRKLHRKYGAAPPRRATSSCEISRTASAASSHSRTPGSVSESDGLWELPAAAPAPAGSSPLPAAEAEADGGMEGGYGVGGGGVGRWSAEDLFGYAFD
jgi:hypothetical protein